MHIYKGMRTSIQSYKHDEQIHRIWKTTEVIRYDDTCLVTAHTKTKVFEKNGRIWVTSEPAVCYFYFKRFYNVIAMLKENGITFYCNISSPAVVDSEGIKYIDYDLDVKIFPDGQYVILDKKEYDENATNMSYPSDLKDVLEKQTDHIIEALKNNQEPFDKISVMMDYEAYKKRKKK